MFVVGALIAAGTVGTYWASLTMQTTQAFALEEVRLTGHARASRDELLRYLDVALGENIFASSLDVLRNNLLRHPWVKEVAVRRVVPNALEVDIVEYVPAGIVALGGLYYVDAEGVPFSRVVVEEAEDFPVMTGLDADLFEHDRKEWSRLVQMGLQFADSAKRGNLTLGGIQLDDTLGVTAHLLPSGTTAALGVDDFDSKIRKLREVRTLLGQRGQQADAYFLDNARHPDRVVARIARKDKTPIYLGAR